MKQIEETLIMWAELKPNCHAGPECNQVKPMFQTQADGDMDSESIPEITLNASTFPAGTKITITVPCCPNCNLPNQGSTFDDSLNNCECGFDWQSWTENKYS